MSTRSSWSVLPPTCASPPPPAARLRLDYRVTVDLGASAFVHAHPGGDHAAIDDLAKTGIRVIDA